MSAITRALVLSFLFLGLTACGDESPFAQQDPFTGRFTTSFNGAPIQVSLERSGSDLKINVGGNGQVQTINATIDGKVATGSFSDPQVMGQGKATLEVKDVDNLKLTLTARNIHGIENTVPFELKREAQADASDSAKPASADGERDPVLVGTWRKTDTYTSGPDFGAAMDTFMTLRADGSFRHGDANFAGGTGAVGGVSRGGDAVQGQWKTQNRQLYARANASQPWQVAARYYVEGNKLVATLPNGEKEVWTKIR